jgi:multimeric flavodoxin WrbA
MNITVLNGSPKGDTSVTLQYVLFMQKKFPQHELKIHNISERIKSIEKEEKRFQEMIDGIQSSDGVLWAFPLYYYLVNSQYKRFIELIWERDVKAVFKNKYTAVLTTSIHFFDHTAHNYMHAICDDLDMNYVGFFSAEMHDLLRRKGREMFVLFAQNFFEAIEKKIPTTKSYPSLIHRKFNFVSGQIKEEKIDPRDKKIVILTDAEDPQSNLGKMIERLRASFSNGVEVINLHQIKILGGCLGCLQCGYDYECSYGDKDEYMEFYKSRVKTADILIFAGSIKDRYLSSRWKLFFDRSFFNTHTPSLIGKQIGFLISGPLTQIPNLIQILEAYTEVQQANLAGFVTDECEDSPQLDALLQNFAERLIQFSITNYVKPHTFLGVGGMKVFRDDMWGKLRFPFQADHKFYKEHGLYDFPQKDYKARIISRILILLTKIPSVRKEIYQNRTKSEMIKPFQKILEEENPKKI